MSTNSGQNPQLNKISDFRILAENIPDTIARFNTDLKIVYINHLIDRPDQYMQRKSSKKNQNYSAQIIEKCIPEIKKAFKSGLASTIVIHVIIDQQNKYFESRIIPERNSINKFETVLCITRDITDWKNAEIKLIKSEEKYRLLVEGQSDLVVKVDNENRFLFVSPSYCSTFGKTEKELLNNTFTPLIHKDDLENTLTEMNKLKTPPYTCYVEQRAMTKQGWRWFAWSDKAIVNEQGNIQEVIGVGRDITQTKEYEHQLIYAKEKAQESDRLKTAFLANMSHEIRTPMNGIIGFSEILNQSNLSEQKRNFFIKIILESSKQLLSIVDDILDISKIETGLIETNIEEVQLNHLIIDLYTFFSPKLTNSRISLFPHKAIKDEESYILTDGAKLRQILNNLISNAIKFTREGHIKFGYQVKNNFIEFYVEDTGIGIERTLHEKIFERFRQVETETNRLYGGTGLGLSIAKKLIELLGGIIWLESEPEKGSTFYFTIPYEPVKTHNKKMAEEENNNNKESRKDKYILIAEDEETNYLFLVELLSGKNYEIVHARNGEEAIKHCNENEDIVLVLMDLKMPKVDGFEATKKIKEIRPDLKIIAQTAYAMKNDKEKAIQSGCDDYISKPIDIRIFKEMLSKYLPA